MRFDSSLLSPDPWVEKLLGGYRQALHVPDETLPLHPSERRRVAVIGSGLAGLSAAVTLAERGFAVTLFEKNAYLGGKIGAWPVELPGGERVGVEHGFHAFFRHYYNLNAFLDRLGVRQHFRPIDDYLILALDGRRFSFQRTSRTPIVNILSMLRQGVYTLGDVMLNPRSMRLVDLLRYHPVHTPARYDQVCFQRFADEVRLPANLRLVFNSFARAFFAPPHKMSMAEVIKSFHFYFLSNAGGLIYDYPEDDYALTLLGPAEQALRRAGAQLRFNSPVEELAPADDKIRVGAEVFDYVVLAADVVGARSIVERSGPLSRLFPSLARTVGALEHSDGYAVLRLWTDRRFGDDLPGFVITDFGDLLDSVSFYHRLEKSSADWSRRTGGGVYELHSYAVPEHLHTEEEVRQQFLHDFGTYFPAFRDCRVLFEHLQLKRDFSAFHVGMQTDRPEVATGLPNLFLAGDWVKLPRPAMLMEAACMSGLLAANAILQREGLRGVAVDSVPPTGAFARREGAV